MPRSPRFVFQNAFYHVFNRGINKQRIFIDTDDYRFFLNKLKKLKNKYDFSIYAVCLMPNHFHISIQTRKDSISKIMSSLTTSYSMYFNRKYTHFGPVFQNRFKSILIENDSYFMTLSRYIYLNPVKAGLVTDPILYPYSSLKEMLGNTPPYLLDGDAVRLNGETTNSKEEYRKFIYEGINADLSEVENLFEKEEVILGTNRFATNAQKKHLKRINKN